VIVNKNPKIILFHLLTKGGAANGDGSNGVKIGVETTLKDGIRGRN
jgi:hypothetical protein